MSNLRSIPEAYGRLVWEGFYGCFPPDGHVVVECPRCHRRFLELQKETGETYLCRECQTGAIQQEP